MSELIHHDERAIRVVIACSDEPQRREVSERLSKNRRLLVKTASDWRELKDLLDGESFEVAVIVGEVDGVSAIEINQNIKTIYRDPPATILLGANVDVHAVIKAFRCGFTDFLPFAASPTRETELRDAIMRAAGIVEAGRQEAQRTRDLERMAQRDSVTGLVNRYYLRERLDQLIEIGRRHGVPFGVILIRVNNLERIRGAFGSKVGDAVLYAFAKRLQASSRKSATFGRLNDDTFLYLLEQEVNEESVTGACSRLGSALAFSLDLDNVSLSLSASVAAGTFPESGSTIADILQAAEVGVQALIAAAGDDDALEVTGTTGQPADAEGGLDRPAMAGAGAGDGAARSESGSITLDRMAFGPRIPSPLGAPRPSATVAATRFADRRNAVRRRCLKRGMLVFNNGFSTVNCLVRDLSATGARVEVEGSFDTLEAFELRLVESGQQYKVEKRWQAGNKFGVRFLI